MENLKHTKGEWYINPRASTNVMCNSKSIANCSGSQSGDNLEQEQSNAKLIAAAPELLEALILANRLITGYIPALSDDHMKIKNAINKATK